MKIAIFVPSLRGGGAERVILWIGRALISAGHSVDLVLMVAKGEYMDEIPSKVRVVDLGCPRLWTSIPALSRYLRRERPEVLLSAMPLANGVAGWARLLSRAPTRLVLSEHNARSLAFGHVEVPRYRILPYLIRPTYRFADGVIAVSGGVASRVKAIPGVRRERVHVVHNPAFSPDIEILAAEPAGHPWFKDPDIPVIMSVGRLVKQKDYPTLIRAFDRVRQARPCRLIILGDDVERGALEKLVSDLALEESVAMPGFVKNPWAWMQRAAVFALTSEHEGFGNVLVEAMACGTPVVATDCPSGPSEILDGGRYGALVSIGDVAGVADALARMLDDPTPPDVLKRRAQDFSIEAAVEGYLRVLSS